MLKSYRFSSWALLASSEQLLVNKHKLSIPTMGTLLNIILHIKLYLRFLYLYYGSGRICNKYSSVVCLCVWKTLENL